MITRCISLAAFVAFTTISCSSRDPSWAGTVRDSAGVIIVSNPEVGVWGLGEGWTVEEELRIGAAEGDSLREFGVILDGGIAVDSEKKIFVLDVQAQEVRVFSEGGEYLRTMGRRGEGPGEFFGARVLLMGPGDTLFVPDQRNLRMDWFNPDGTYGGSVPFQFQEEGWSQGFRSNAAGVIAEQVNPWIPGNPWPEDPQDAVILWASGRTRSDTLALFPSGEQNVMKDGFTYDTWYAAFPCWDLTDDMRLLVGRSDQYRFSLISPGGQVDRVITKAHEPRAVLDADVEKALAHLENRWRTMGASPENLQQLLSRQYFSEVFPAFRALYEGPGGTIWVQKVKPPSELEDGEALWYTLPSDWADEDWDVFDGEGRFLGVVTMPERFYPSLFEGDKIIGVWYGENDVAYVSRMGIVARPGALSP